MDLLLLTPPSPALAPAPVSFCSTDLIPENLPYNCPITADFSPPQCSWKAAVRGKRLISSSNYSFRNRSIQSVGGFEVRAFFPNPIQEPILKEALKEPVAFVGGIFAGLLRLDLNEEPLKEWVTRTVEASGITQEETSKRADEEEQMPQEIEIE